MIKGGRRRRGRGGETVKAFKMANGRVEGFIRRKGESIASGLVD